jgi:hypothetical protein
LANHAPWSSFVVSFAAVRGQPAGDDPGPATLGRPCRSLRNRRSQISKAVESARAGERRRRRGLRCGLCGPPTFKSFGYRGSPGSVPSVAPVPGGIPHCAHRGVTVHRNGDAALDPETAVVHQATGMIMARFDISVDAAAEWLRENARAARRPVSDVARDVVAHRLDLRVGPGEDPPPDASTPPPQP